MLQFMQQDMQDMEKITTLLEGIKNIKVEYSQETFQIDYQSSIRIFNLLNWLILNGHDRAKANNG